MQTAMLYKGHADKMTCFRLNNGERSLWYKRGQGALYKAQMRMQKVQRLDDRTAVEVTHATDM